MSVEKLLDELWLGVKGQSNSVIAGSFRNSFRASLAPNADGGRALIVRGGSPTLPTTLKLRMPSCDGAGVRLWGISFIVEMETAQTAG